MTEGLSWSFTFIETNKLNRIGEFRILEEAEVVPREIYVRLG